MSSALTPKLVTGGSSPAAPFSCLSPSKRGTGVGVSPEDELGSEELIGKLTKRRPSKQTVAPCRVVIKPGQKAGLGVGQPWLRERHPIRLKRPGVYYWLGKWGGVLKVPRQTPCKKDAAAAEAFQHTLGAQWANLNAAGGRRVRLGGADEHRYGLIPVVRKCWTLRGVRPTAPYRTQYARGAISTRPWQWTGEMRRSF